MEVQIVKKIFLATVTLLVLMFALSGCGVFSQPELGSAYKAVGISTIQTAFAPLAVKAYEIVIDLQFGSIWDANKVKSGTVKFNNVVLSGDRVETNPPEYNVVDGSYNTTDRTLVLKCQEKTNSSLIVVKGRVSTDHELVENGFIYKTHNSTDLSNRIGFFDAIKQ